MAQDKPEKTPTVEDVDLIESEEELAKILDGSANVDVNLDDDAPDGGDKDKDKDPPSKGKDNDDDDIFNVDSDKRDDDDDGDELELDEDGNPIDKGDDDDGDGDDKPEEFKGNIISYLNEQHDMKLNVDALPEDMSREDEAKYVSELFSRMVNGVNKTVAQFEDVREVLKDEEVASFIKAKQEGKTMKDFAREYAQTTDGLPDEILVEDDLKAKFPTLDEEEISEMVKDYKEKGRIEKMATAIRESRKEAEKAQAKQQELLQQEEERKDELARQQEVQKFANFVGSVKNVYGIPLDDKTKSSLYEFAVKQDAQGLTELDKALQSDEGVLLATLGIKHLKKLIGAAATTKANRKAHSVMNKLFETPEKLQSGRKTKDDDIDFDAELANKF